MYSYLIISNVLLGAVLAWPKLFKYLRAGAATVWFKAKGLHAIQVTNVLSKSSLQPFLQNNGFCCRRSRHWWAWIRHGMLTARKEPLNRNADTRNGENIACDGWQHWELGAVCLKQLEQSVNGEKYWSLKHTLYIFVVINCMVWEVLSYWPILRSFRKIGWKSFD